MSNVRQYKTDLTRPAHFMKPVVVESIEEADIEIPKGWTEIISAGSRVFRPIDNTLPCVKVHYAPLMVDVDFKFGKVVNSKRINCSSIAELIRVTKDQLWEWS